MPRRAPATAFTATFYCNARIVEPTTLAGQRNLLAFLCNASPPFATRPTVGTQEPESSGGKSIDAAGAGASWQSPGWLTQLNLLWGGKGGIPVRCVLFAPCTYLDRIAVANFRA